MVDIISTLYHPSERADRTLTMKHLRETTNDKRHVLHSLRHNMKDWLMLAGVPERVEHRILGHSLGGEGDRVYGGDEARLKTATEAMRKAIALAP